jgi:hypothetical protein
VLIIRRFVPVPIRGAMAKKLRKAAGIGDEEAALKQSICRSS